MDGAARAIGAELVAAREECLSSLRALRRARRRARAGRTRARLRGRPADRGGARGEARPRPRARRDRARPASARRLDLLRRPRPALVRLAGRAADGGARAPARRGALLTERRDEPPLLLLDDVLSELDPTRRRVLVEQVEGRGQTLITATTADALPGEPGPASRGHAGRGAWSARPGDQAGALALRPAGRDAGARSPPGPPRSGRWSPRTPGRRGSRATERCT